jgi:hypothetical protein
MEIQVERNNRVAYKHKYHTWRTIAIFAMVAFALTGIELIRSMAVTHSLRIEMMGGKK